ncbi:MAG: DNA topoisomerase IV subunit A [Spirochaetia bacterium]|nr:DNA topoisomerase IV subunit A [Spirochaetia bacterium]
MAHAQKLFKKNFLEYASYVIKERAIPDISDGLKPVQRRIMHSLFEMDDGKFHKVANVVGHCMKYHPHGDSSIYEALVNLANTELFIDKQGNFGNILTGDMASAARYIECRLLPYAKKVLYNPELTEYQDSYDGRNREPLSFPAKLPVLLIQGAEGIAVGMSTKILPHNINEVLDAMSSQLRGESFEIFPDFPGGGFLDVSGYEEGNGKVLARAKLNTEDEKKIIIEELPFGVSTEKLITSIESAAKKGKVKISNISDFTTDKISIEINLPRNTYTQDVVDALYAFTDCEQSISINLLVIKEGLPTIMTVPEVIGYQSERLVNILRKELENEKRHLLDRLHARTLERIFIEQRIYKSIEKRVTQEQVMQAVLDGFIPYRDELMREVTPDDVERLLKIPIRRISLYDINKAKHEVDEINLRLKEIAYHLEYIVEYALDTIESMRHTSGPLAKRKTKIISFDKVDVREAANRDLTVSYDPKTGYVGYGVKDGTSQCKASLYDRLLIIKKSGSYLVTDTIDKYFAGKGMRFCCLADKTLLEQTVFTILYQERSTKLLYVKRCQITQFIMNRSYELVPEDAKILKLSTREDAEIFVQYKPSKRMKVYEESFPFSGFLVKGVKANGVRLTTKPILSMRIRRAVHTHPQEHEGDQEESESEKQLQLNMGDM